ncbi:hypothetical protein [Nocardioides sp.]|uniref:hypothetical protein n=1 Tax=Nocardioides sp. TaxID=35761 RepID=UPI00286BB9C4|nr:hypothetical protein [Nocardioides sp.]
MTASDDLLTLLGSAYDAISSGDVAPLVPRLSAGAVCVVTDEVELTQERLSLRTVIARLGDLAPAGHRLVGGPSPRVSESADRLWVTDHPTVVLADGTQRPLQVTVLATCAPDGSLLVDQVNLAAPVRDRADAHPDLVG